MTVLQMITWSICGLYQELLATDLLRCKLGKAMQLGGGAEDLANLLTSKLGTKFTIAVLCVTTLILSYGGVSCYVIVFVMYPIALNMFKKADLPRHLIPAIVAAGSFTAVT